MCDKGGGLLATGSSSCIVKPNIPCKDGKYKKKDDKKISKIVFGKKSEEYTNREKNIDDIIKKIPGYKDWSLVFDELCKPPPFNEAKKMEKGLYDCRGEPSVEKTSIKLKGTKNSKKILSLGDKVFIQPSHCDPTVNLYNNCKIITNNKIIDTWKIDARGYI